MIPYSRHRVGVGDREAVARVLSSPRLTQGPEVDAFEGALASRTGCRRAVTVSSGTAALQIALQALGVGPGDEVLVPSLSFLATANAVLQVGGKPVFVDVGADCLCLDPEDLARKVTSRTVGAILMHYGGHSGDADGCRRALGPDRFLLEDACHALGAEDEGRPVGSLGDAACFSFHPAKHVTAGEGGAISTSRVELADRCRRLREHGIERRSDRWLGLGLPAAQAHEQSGGWVYEMHELSGNHRLSDLAAALGRSQLERLDESLAERRRLARRYDEVLEKDGRLLRSRERPGTRSAWHLYPVRLRVEAIEGGRAAVHRALQAAGIAVQVHYIPIHLQPYYRQRLGTRFGDLPQTEDAYLRLLSLPLFPGLSESDQDRVLEVLLSTLEALRR